MSEYEIRNGRLDVKGFHELTHEITKHEQRNTEDAEPANCVACGWVGTEGEVLADGHRCPKCGEVIPEDDATDEGGEA